jgi:intracellular septation protein
VKSLLRATKLLLLDLASTVGFLAVFLLTNNLPLSVGLGVGLGIAQIGWQFARHKQIDTMEWLSLFLIVGSGAATLLTHDPRFVMLKPSLIYVVVGVVMLKPGWMNRYLPPVGMALVPDVAIVFGFVWAGLMFTSAALNVLVALNYSVVAWSTFMSAFAIVSKLALFLISYGVMRYVGVRRFRAMSPAERSVIQALQSATIAPARSPYPTNRRSNPSESRSAAARAASVSTASSVCARNTTRSYWPK